MSRVKVLTLLAVVCNGVAAALLGFVVGGVTTDSSGQETSSSVSLAEAQGWGIVAVLFLPALVAALAYAFASSRPVLWVAVALTVGILMWLLSVAIWFVPGLLALLVAAFLARTAPAASQRAHQARA